MTPGGARQGGLLQPAPRQPRSGGSGRGGVQTLKRYFATEREAFTDFTITRGHVVIGGDFVAAQTTFTGVFAREFSQSPVAPLPPTGKPFTQNLLNIFRYDENGKLAEEWAMYDVRDLLRQWGAEGR